MAARMTEELASLLEQSEGPSRELDARIVAVVQAGMRHPWFVNPPPFTKSIDAAMTLVPVGWAIDRWMIWPGQPSSLSLFETRRNSEGEHYHSGDMARIHIVAATPALALCAAALKAGNEDGR